MVNTVVVASESGAMRTYSVGLLGAGRIVAGFDTPDSPSVLTHCHALRGHHRFAIAGVWDPDRSALTAAGARWSLPLCNSLAELAQRLPEVWLVGAPDSMHAACLDEILLKRPRLVVCEKPLTLNVSDSRRLAAAYAEAGIPLLVCYQRRCDVDVNLLRDRYRTGSLGEFLGGTVYYSKGLLHNGSHAIDLLRYVLGDVRSCAAFSARNDYVATDPTVSGRVELAAGEVYLVAGDERLHSLFEIDLIFANGRCRFLDSGMTIQWSAVADDPTFPGYRALRADALQPSTLGFALRRLWDVVALRLDSGVASAIEASEAIATQDVCEALANSIPAERRAPV